MQMVISNCLCLYTFATVDYSVLPLQVGNIKNLKITQNASKHIFKSSGFNQASKILDWISILFYEVGFKKTVEGYFANHDVAAVKAKIDTLLVERWVSYLLKFNITLPRM